MAIRNMAKVILIVSCLSAANQTGLCSINYYDITLPIYPPGTYLYRPTSINDLEQICGADFNSGGHLPCYIWRANQLEDIPFTAQDLFGNKYAQCINNNGDVVGGSQLAQLWNGSQVVNLGTLGGGSSTAYAINDRNQVVGRSADAQDNFYPFLWENGAMTGLGTLGGNYGFAVDINESTVVVGSSKTAEGTFHAFVWQNNVMTDLGTLGGDNSYALSINDANDIVGYAEDLDGYQHACIWQNGQIRRLVELGGFQSQAYSINNNGDIVGWAETDTGYRPLVIWDPTGVRRLENLIISDSGWRLINFEMSEQGLTVGFDINNNGAILGRGNINGREASFLMKPANKAYLQADFNGDRQVNNVDLATFAGQWLK